MRGLIARIAKYQTTKTWGFCVQKQNQPKDDFILEILTIQVFIGERMQQNVDVQWVPGIIGNVVLKSGGRSQKADSSRFDANQ